MTAVCFDGGSTAPAALRGHLHWFMGLPHVSHVTGRWYFVPSKRPIGSPKLSTPPLQSLPILREKNCRWRHNRSKRNASFTAVPAEEFERGCPGLRGIADV